MLWWDRLLTGMLGIMPEMTQAGAGGETEAVTSGSASARPDPGLPEGADLVPQISTLVILMK